jgi:hypothetical protein
VAEAEAFCAIAALAMAVLIMAAAVTMVRNLFIEALLVGAT